MTLSLEPFAGTSFGASRYTPEFGSGGKLLVNKPSSGAKFRPSARHADPAGGLRPAALGGTSKVAAASWAGGSGRVWGLDYLVLVPARRRLHPHWRRRAGRDLPGLRRVDQRYQQADPPRPPAAWSRLARGVPDPTRAWVGSTLEPTHPAGPEIGSLGGAFDPFSCGRRGVVAG